MEFEVLTTDGLRRSFNVRVAMRDGVELSVDVTFPAGPMTIARWKPDRMCSFSAPQP